MSPLYQRMYRKDQSGSLVTVVLESKPGLVRTANLLHRRKSKMLLRSTRGQTRVNQGLLGGRVTVLDLDHEGQLHAPNERVGSRRQNDHGRHHRGARNRVDGKR